MSKEIPDLREIMRGISPDDILARLKRSSATPQSAQKTEEGASPRNDASKNEAPKEDKGDQKPDDDCNVWSFMVEPVLQAIGEKLKSNALLPIFLVENPYPSYVNHFAKAISSKSEYRIIVLDDKPDLSGLTKTVVKITQESGGVKGVIILCTSRTSLPAEYRSLVRTDGYLNIPATSFDRLKQYAVQCKQVALDEQDAGWAKWVGPQELLVANILSPHNWLNGLKQLASQRQESQSIGKHRKLEELYGVETAKKWAKQLFNDIELARKSQIDWDEVDKGALFVGRPGTGKTTLAKAIASESGVDFIPVTPVKDWMAGNGLDDCIQLMTATFSAARQRSPSIVFIDEIDSIGNRENFTGQNASWNTAFLNALLTEMDGFAGRDKVIVIGATNYEAKIDPALLRSGRLDRIIYISSPGVDALTSMYQGMLKAYNASLTDEDMRECAKNSLGLTGADVEKIVRGARRRARLENNRTICANDILDEIFHIPPDAERRPLNREDLRITAFHEAGHALIGLLLDSQKNQVRMASVIPGDDSLGFVAITPSENNETRTSLLDRICVSLAGRASEELMLGKENVTTGAGGFGNSNDLSKARRLAEAFVGVYGFSEAHPNWHEPSVKDEEARDVVQAQYQRVMSLLEGNRNLLEKIAGQLVEKHVLTKEDLAALMESGK